MYPETHRSLNAASQEYFYRTKRVANFGAPGPKVEDWKRYKDAMGVIEGWLKKNGENQKYVAGNSITYADIMLAARLQRVRKVFGEDSEEWKGIQEWHQGRWGALIGDFKQYEVSKISY